MKYQYLLSITVSCVYIAIIIHTYSEVVLYEVEPIHPNAEYSEFAIMCDCTDKYIKLTNWSFVLIFCSNFPGVFVTGAEMNDDKDVDLPFIIFCHYQNIRSCCFHKHILSQHHKTYPLCMNILNVENNTGISCTEIIQCYWFPFIILHPINCKMVFIYHMFTLLTKIIVQVNGVYPPDEIGRIYA